MRYLRYPPPWHTAAAGFPVLAANSVSQVISNTTIWLVGILAALWITRDGGSTWSRVSFAG